MSVTHPKLTKFKKVKWLFGKEIEIPKSWFKCQLKDLGNLSAGGTPSTFEKKFWDKGTIPWISSSEVKNNRIYESEKKITKLGLQNSATKLFPKGTVLIAITGFGMTRGRTAILEIDATTNQSIVGITTNSKILNPVFLWHLLRSMYWTVRNFAQGTQQPGLNLEILENFQIVYPAALQEQTQIASILSGVDATIEATQKVIEKTKRLKMGLMQQLLTRGINHKKFKVVNWLFDRKIEMPKEWELNAINKLAQINPEHIQNDYNFQKIEYVDISSIENFQITKYEKYTVTERPSRAQRIIKANDLIISTVRPNLKSFSKVKNSAPNLICSTGFTVVRPNIRSDVDFLFSYFQSHWFAIHVFRHMEGLAYPAMTSSDVSNFIIATPSNSNERLKIASILSGVDAVYSLLLYTKTHAMQTIFLRLWRVTTS